MLKKEYKFDDHWVSDNSKLFNDMYNQVKENMRMDPELNQYGISVPEITFTRAASPH